MAILSFTTIFGSTPELKFWKWFESNNEMLFSFEQNQEPIFNKLSEAMSQVNPELTFEFSPIRENGKREFVISAGGIKSAFPAVEKLFESAPELERWSFIKYRPRRNPLNDLTYEGKSISATEVHYNLYNDEDENKVGIIIFLDGYNEEQHNIYGNLGYLFLDEALGEYDVETKLGFIEFRSRESATDKNPG